MRLGQYHRCEIALVTTLALHGYCYGTTMMRPKDIARLQGCTSKSVYRSILMAEHDKLVVRNRYGMLRLTDVALDAIREGFNGIGKRRADGQCRQVAGAR